MNNRKKKINEINEIGNEKRKKRGNGSLTDTRKIHLGPGTPLAEHCGAEVLRLDVATPAEAVRAIMLEHPGARAIIEAGQWMIRDGDHLAGGDWDLVAQRGRSDIYILPAGEGASGTGMGKIFAGIGLVVFGVFTGGTYLIAYPAFALSTAGYVALGAAVALSGVARIMAPTPQANPMDLEEADSRQSSIMSNPSSLSQPGEPVPIVYGTTRIGALRISLSARNESTSVLGGGILDHITSVNVIDVVSEGEIGGLSGGRAGVIANGVSVLTGGLDSEPDLVFTEVVGIDMGARVNSVSSEIFTVNQGVTVANPVTVRVDDPNVSRAIITLLWPALYSATATIPPGPTVVEYDVEVNANSTGWVPIGTPSTWVQIGNNQMRGLPWYGYPGPNSTTPPWNGTVPFDATVPGFPFWNASDNTQLWAMYPGLHPGNPAPSTLACTIDNERVHPWKTYPWTAASGSIWNGNPAYLVHGKNPNFGTPTPAVLGSIVDIDIAVHVIRIQAAETPIPATETFVLWMRNPSLTGSWVSFPMTIDYGAGQGVYRTASDPDTCTTFVNNGTGGILPPDPTPEFRTGRPFEFGLYTGTMAAGPAAWHGYAFTNISQAERAEWYANPATNPSGTVGTKEWPTGPHPVQSVPFGPATNDFDFYIEPTGGTNVSGGTGPDFIEVINATHGSTAMRLGCINTKVDGYSLDPYLDDIVADLDAHPAGPPWDVRVTRTTPDLGALSVSRDAFSVQSYSTEIDANISFKNTAMIQTSGPLAAFGGSLPILTYEVAGLKVQVPTGYDPLAGTFASPWPGTFQAARQYSADPAWILWDLLTSERYGLGIDPERIDKWSFATASRRNLDLVPDLVTNGATERRYEWHGAVSRADDGFKIASQIAAVMDAQIWVSTHGLIFLGQDSPQTEISRLITQANVIGGLFTYEGSSVDARRNVSTVTYRDKSKSHNPEVIRQARPFSIERYGETSIQLDAPGVTSKGQAIRRARYLLITDETENQTVRFQIGLENSGMQPGDLVEIADASRSQEQNGSRISTSFGVGGTLYLGVPGPTDWATIGVVGVSRVRWLTTSGVVGDGNLALVWTPTLLVVNGTPDWSLPIQEGAPVMISTATPETWRVLEIVDDGDGLYTVLAVQHDADKWTAIDDPSDLGTAYTFPGDVWPPPGFPT